MNKRKRIQILVWLGLAALMVILLAASLPLLVLHPGRPFSLEAAALTAAAGGNVLGTAELLFVIFQGVLTLTLVLLPFFILINLLTREGRARLMADLIAMASILLALSLLPPSPAQQAAQEALQAPAFGPPTPSLPAEQFVPHVSYWLQLLMTVALALLVSTVAAGVVWWIRRRRQPAPSGPLEQLARQAQDTIDALRAGEDIQDVVIRSYAQMSHVLQEERGIRREQAMTPYEFAQSLKEQGLPAEPVRDLTRLFEAARYGHRLSGAKEEQRAIASLQAIVAYARVAGSE
jgi:hypothetical protein